jgi:hypothetical protein
MKSIKPHIECVGYTIFYALAILVIILVSARPKSEQINQNKTLYGALYWPDSSMPDSTIKKSIKILLESTSIIIAQIPWSGDNEKSLQKIQWYSSISRNHDKALMIALDWQTPERLNTINNIKFSNESTQRAFIQFINDAIRLYKPDYLNLGVEANYLAHTDPKQYRAFTSITRQLHQQKTCTSETKFGVSLQLDLIQGFHNHWSDTPTRSIPYDFNHLDFIGLSSYPAYNNACLGDSLCQFPDFAPTDSLFPTIGISETGISSVNNSLLKRKSFTSSVLQTEYEFIIWGNLTDLSDTSYWHSHNGLITTSNTPKPEHEIWRQRID